MDEECCGVCDGPLTQFINCTISVGSEPKYQLMAVSCPVHEAESIQMLLTQIIRHLDQMVNRKPEPPPFEVPAPKYAGGRRHD